ncbi:TonB-linked SusC/RagA family outer membrane protein [Pedobacter sp. UYP30]|uniref:SusC/RagA family TonB-linked outer membrane protein n=1 Tax=Pedobacter sp. UYP30 TaxID=1756400 RepID=UPI003395E442
MRYSRVCLAIFMALIAMSISDIVSGRELSVSSKSNSFQLQDTTKKVSQVDSVGKDSLLNDSAQLITETSMYNSLSAKAVTRETKKLSLFPAIALQQTLKSNYAGLYIQEPSGEPGSVQNMFIRGAAMPLLSKKDVYQIQPLVVLDGIPLIGDHPFAFDVQQYDFNRLGTATNLLSNIDMNNIASVQVLKDLAAVAIYGPRAANGAIIVTSKQPGYSKKISFDSYVGMVQKPTVNTINGQYENDFRQRFYDKYTTNGRYSDDEVYPVYLSDSLNSVYSGKSDWTDLYYKNAVIYGVNVALSGGTDRANFRFSLNNTKSKGVADDTGLDRYGANFNINMRPIKWLLFSAYVNANRVNRTRNKSLRDRFAQLNYFPDLSAPLPPNKEYYGTYLTQYSKGFDDNKNNIIEGYARLVGTFGKLKITSSFNVDYNEGYRDVFYPRTLLQGNSYASNYYGSNQRLMIENRANYDLKINEDQDVNFEAGQSIQYDTHKYDNAYAYKGTNDFIKINLLDSRPQVDGADNPAYLTPTAFPRELTFRALDRTKSNLVSFYGKANYSYKDKYFVGLTMRADGSSNAQPTSRWFYSPVLSAAWSVKKEFLTDISVIDDAVLRASVGRLGRLNVFDNFAEGPQYTASVGYTGNVTVPGYNGFGVLTRPYAAGFVGYDIPWAYTEQLNIGLDVALLKNKLNASFDYYTKTDKKQLLGIPSYAEYGYRQSIESGMDVNNTGVDLSLNYRAIAHDNFTWVTGLNFNYNSNKLKALPRGLDQIVIGDRLLKVGSPVDQYWLLQNKGIYNADADVPVVNGQPLKYNGIPLKAGDPRWVDQNGDNNIDDNDRVLQGNSLPKFYGGFDNNFTYKQWSLNTNLYFNLGRKVLNQESATRFDFVNSQGSNSISSVKEITFWEKRGDYTKYPLYNPWSTVIPYRLQQDLFLENASFLKLRSVSVGYDFTDMFKKNKVKISKMMVYASANNIFTITKYSGQDPELIGYNGIDGGYGQPIPRTYTLGVKMEL